MGYISTGTGDRFSVLLVSLMAVLLALVDKNPFQPCFVFYLNHLHNISISNRGLPSEGVIRATM